MIELKNVSKYYYNQGGISVGIRRVSLKMEAGEFIAITGESGSGKSTLLNVLSGLDKYDEGELYVNGEETSYFSVSDMENYRKQYVGFVFQNYNIIDSYTVYENVVASLVIQNYDKETRKKRALELIERVGLTKQRNQKTSKLSGGQKQRVVIARALAKDAPIIVADEPTGNLDSESGDKIMELLKEVSKDKLVIVVTHNFQQIEKHITRKIHMYDGEVTEDKVLSIPQKVDEIPLVQTNMTKASQFYFGFLNLIRQPKKGLVLFLSFVLLMTSVFAIYGFNKASMLQQRFHYGMIFSNTFEERFIVKRADNAPITQTELDTFYSYKEVQDVVHHDIVLDQSWILDDGFRDIYTNILPSIVARYKVIEGRLPEAADEVVISSELKSRYDYKLNDATYITSSYNRLFKMPMKIVGFHDGDLGNSLVHQHFINQSDTHQMARQNPLIEAMQYHNTFNKVNFDDKVDLNFLSPSLSTSIEEGYIYFREDFKTHFMENGMTEEEIAAADFKYTRINIANDGGLKVLVDKTVKIRFFTTDTFPNETGTVIMNPNDYHINLEITQSTLLLRSIDDIRSLKSKLGDTYIYAHPSSLNSSGASGMNFFMMISIYIFIFAVFAFSLLVINIIVKNVYKARNKDIAIMRSIGATKRDIKNIFAFEQITIVFFALVTSFIILKLIEVFVAKRKFLMYINITEYVFIILLFFIFAFIVIRRYISSLFGKTVITTIKGGEGND